MKPKLEKLLEKYSAEVQESIRFFVKSIVTNINQAENTGILEEGIRVVPLHMVGAPGIGKTTLIAKIAGILGIASVSKKISPNLKMEDIEGSQYDYEQNIKNGFVLDALIESEKTHQSKCCILFLDEIDKVFPKNKKFESPITSSVKIWLLDIMNRETTHAKHNAFAVKIGIENVYIVLAGNRDFIADFQKEDRDAFNTRRQMLSINPLEPKAKYAIGMEYYEKLLSELEKQNKESLKLMSMGKIIFNDKHREKIEEIIKYDNFPGVRVLQYVIKAYVNYVRTNEFFGEFGQNDFIIAEQYKIYGQLETVPEEEGEKQLESEKNALEKKGELEVKTLKESSSIDSSSPETKAKKEQNGDSILKASVDTGVGLGLAYLPYQTMRRASVSEVSESSQNGSTGMVKQLRMLMPDG